MIIPKNKAERKKEKQLAKIKRKVSKTKRVNIKNKDDLAELAVDELQDIIEISSDDASKMIMKAREHWFN